jgi:hypothetical protein
MASRQKCITCPSSVGLLVFVVAWKIGTESLFLAAGQPIWGS